ncbi:alpha/beta-hydrolase [Viridothelium virens]|uniref:Alpha/beta-hydrolase n=1 Tax=Viridothelium virens TaxID=1048519 RepID=A0A6A6HJP1_VIRVR|nr:alpha/beta-hydrolase [Viridothelium virens]
MGSPFFTPKSAPVKIATITEPYSKDLQYRGFVEGATIKEKSSGKILCHYFGGLPYALPPIGPFRWRKPRELPLCYRYGTRANPGRFNGGAGVCPQPAKSEDAEKQEEDCLQCNIWIPIGEPPKDGWPVLFYIHGGFLQWGSPNALSPAALLAETSVSAIVVAPAYRLNAFGFLACTQLQAESQVVGNYGFWDQRLALEWTHQNISYFDGNPSNITVAGYSAGAHSTFYQLAYDLFLPPQKRLIKRAMMLSNGPGLQPRPLSDTQLQYEQLLSRLSISPSLSTPEKLSRLRNASAADIVQATGDIPLHEFRAFTDGVFVRHDLFHSINSGEFGRRMKDAGVKILLGECRDEHYAYAIWRAPQNSAESMFRRLRADYSQDGVESLRRVYCPTGRLPEGVKDWSEMFGRVYADVQVHCMQRGLIDRLVKGGLEPGKDMLRYRLNWRVKGVWAPVEWGVTHSTDMAIWFFGNGTVLDKGEKEVAKKWLKPVSEFLSGKDVNWGTDKEKSMRRLNEEAETDTWDDDRWSRGLEVWNALTTEQRPSKL